MALSYLNIRSFEQLFDEAKARNVHIDFNDFASFVADNDFNDLETTVYAHICIETQEHQAFIHNVGEIVKLFGFALPWGVIKATIKSLEDKGHISVIRPCGSLDTYICRSYN